MGNTREILPVKLITGIITAREDCLAAVKKTLIRKFGGIDYESPVYNFDHTDYYLKEFGPNLKRYFFSFKNLICPSKIAKIKLLTNKIEKKYSLNNKRWINIDPGYIEASKLVLATTKNYSHRIYLSRGIFAEVTLSYKSKSFVPFDWTYTDYKTAQYIDTFNKIREIYMAQIVK